VDAQNQSKEDIGILDEFQRDFVEFWGRLPNKFFFGALLLMWLALFQFLGNSTFGYIDTPSLFRWMMGAYTSPSGDDGHGFLVPLVVLAVGEQADLAFLQGTELLAGERNRIAVNFAGATRRAGVFACGDAAFGHGTVGQAIATGRRAAELASDYMEKKVGS